MKIVLDTNVLLISVPFHTPYYPIFNAFIDGVYSLCVTTDILAEYAEKLQEKYALRPSVADNVLNAIDSSPDVIRVSKWFSWNLITADPDDNKFVDCAIAANAEFIVTNDKHFAVLKEIAFPSIQVISADNFLDLLLR